MELVGSSGARLRPRQRITQSRPRSVQSKHRNHCKHASSIISSISLLSLSPLSLSSLSLFLHLSPYPYSHLFLCPSVHLSICPYISLSPCPSVHLYMSPRPYVCLIVSFSLFLIRRRTDMLTSFFKTHYTIQYLPLSLIRSSVLCVGLSKYLRQ